MPTKNEVRVMQLLDAIEIPDQAGPAVERWGNDAVTVVCETALGTFAGIAKRVRKNAVDLLGVMSHPQALETTALLVTEANSDVSIRAMRCAGQQKNRGAVNAIAGLLEKKELAPLLAVEAVKALLAIDSSTARKALRTYAQAGPDELPHRSDALVVRYLESHA